MSGWRSIRSGRLLRRLLLALGLLLTAGSVSALAAALAVNPKKLTVFSTTLTPATCTLQEDGSVVVPDAYVDESSSKQNDNFGSDADLVVTSEPSKNTRVFLLFDLSSCSPAIPSGAIVQSATLTLRLSDAPNQSGQYEARRVTAGWVESTITWSNQPGVAGAATSSTATGTTNDVDLGWTVTSDVQSFVTGAASNFGWRIGDSAESSTPKRKGKVRSSEFTTTTAHRPKLVVTYLAP